jgi:hypothetical protein
MNDWQTYQNGNPRQPWDLERLARHRAAKLGYRLHRSRRRKGPDNAGTVVNPAAPCRSALARLLEEESAPWMTPAASSTSGPE